MNQARVVRCFLPDFAVEQGRMRSSDVSNRETDGLMNADLKFAAGAKNELETEDGERGPKAEGAGDEVV